MDTTERALSLVAVAAGLMILSGLSVPLAERPQAQQSVVESERPIVPLYELKQEKREQMRSRRKRRV